MLERVNEVNVVAEEVSAEVKNACRCNSCNKELALPVDILKQIVACPFCGKPFAYEKNAKMAEMLAAIESLAVKYGATLLDEALGDRLLKSDKLKKILEAVNVQLPDSAEDLANSIAGSSVVKGTLNDIKKNALRGSFGKVVKNATVLATSPDSQMLVDPRDGEVYKTIEINGKVWMAENLRYKCRGSFIMNDDDGNLQSMGRLYTYDSVQKRCAPKGWHVATAEEWNELLEFAKENAQGDVACSLMDADAWDDSEITPTDEFGFSAVPVGIRDDYENYVDEDEDYECEFTAFWVGQVEKNARNCAKKASAFNSLASYANKNSFKISAETAEFEYQDTDYALSVRLVKD